MSALLAGLTMLAVLVIVHESGHFVFAKWFGIGVPVYSIGMGPRLFGVRWRGTDYRLSLLPVGGYVRMAGADPFGEEDPDDVVALGEDFMRRPVWQRLIVMLGGPLFNLILPIVLVSAVLMAGEPVPDNVVGTVQPGSIGEELGLRPRDRVLAVNGAPTVTWGEVGEAFLASPSDVTVSIARGPERIEVRLPLVRVDGEPRPDRFGLYASRLAARVGVDDPTSPAARAGLVTGDLVAAVDGRAVADWLELEAALSDGESHTIRYGRADPADPTQQALLETDAQMTRAGWTPREGEPFPNAWGIQPSMLFVGEVATPPETPSGWRAGLATGRAWLLGAKAETVFPAYAAGLQPGDRLWSADGARIRSWPEVIAKIAATAGEGADPTDPNVKPRAVLVQVIRAGQVVDMTVTPKLTREHGPTGEVRYRPILGIVQYPDAFVEPGYVRKFYTPAQAVPRAFSQSWSMFSNTVSGLRRLATREVAISEGLGGPIQIFRMAGQGLAAGWFTFVRLIAVISVSLGVINLLPVPALDGGQISLYLIEWVRGRRLSDALRERVQMVGVLALIALMLAVAVFDIDRVLKGFGV